MDQTFTIIDFLNSEFQTKENPFFLITSDQFLELENLDFLSTQENKISYIKINYNNLNDFFPEDYLFKLACTNHSLSKLKMSRISLN